MKSYEELGKKKRIWIGRRNGDGIPEIKFMKKLKGKEGGQ